MIKAIYLDFDGTFYTHSNESVPASTVSAVKAAQSKGVKVFLSTGRSKAELEVFDFAGVEFDGYILCNGQIILDNQDRVLFQNPIEGQLKEKILYFFNEKIMPVQLCTKDEIYANFINDHLIKTQQDIGSPLNPVHPYDGKDIILAALFFDGEKEKELAMSLKEDADVTYWHFGAIDVVPKGASKARGLEIVNRYYHIDQSECMAMGDGENDIAMLRYAGIGVAMGNSDDEVKRNADYITDDIDEDGLANCFKHFEII